MFHKRLILSLASMFLIISLFLSACGAGATTEATSAPEGESTEPETVEEPTPESDTTNKVATFIWTQEFDTLNPLYTNMWFSEVTQQLWNCWPWNFDETPKGVPNLVVEMPSFENGGISTDGKVITLKLREDLQWSDGTPLTAEDFVFTYEMYIDPNNSVASTYPYDAMESVEAADPQTVVITFPNPFAPWEATLYKGLLPAHILKPVFEADGNINEAEWNLRPEVGCGPYVFAEWETGSFARFIVNENYWGKKPNIDEIFFRFVPDDASQVAALLAGDGDIGTFIAYSDVNTLEDAGVEIRKIKSGFSEGWFFVINEEISPIISDVNVRKAIAMAVDREAIVRDLLLGLTAVPASYWDAIPFYNTPPLENYPYDPDGARQLLEEAGWVDTNSDGVREKNGEDLVITYGTTIREVRQDTQAVVQQMLGEVGIKVELFSYDSDVFFESLDNDGPAAKGDIDIMQWSDSTSFPDPDYYYWYCSEIPSAEYPQGANWQYYCNEELDELFTLQTTQVDTTERQKSFSRINQIFYDEVVWLGLWQDPDVWAIGSKLKNVSLSGVTPFYTIVDWDLEP